jgi:hypothetical protein
LLRALAFHEHFDNLGAGELGGWVLAFGEHLAHFSTADEHVVLAVVGASFGSSHTLAFQAEEGVFEE